MIKGVIFLLVGLMPFQVMAASFDCSKAVHPLEQLICDNPELSALDERLADVYKGKLEMFLDKNAVRTQQIAWQKKLRSQCATSCLYQNIAQSYGKQISFLESLSTESYAANYKTADIATLNVTHIDKGQIDIALTRQNIDDPDAELLCLFPMDDSEAGAIAKITSPTEASWTNGSCALDLKFTRDKKTMSVVSIDVIASDGCKSYCGNTGYSLGDSNFIPENDWGAGTD